MAFKEVELTPEEQAAMGGTYKKFNAIGDTLTGRFLRTQPRTGSYAKPGNLSWVFKSKNEAGAICEMIVDPTMDLEQKLEKAVTQGLKPGMIVKMIYSANVPMEGNGPDGQPKSPKKIYKVAFDPDSAAPAQPKPPPPPPPSDDIPF